MNIKNTFYQIFHFLTFFIYASAFWVDHRNGYSDIYASILSFQNPDSIISGIINPNVSIPENILLQNYPNPFNSSTIIEYSIKKNSYAKILLYDISGRLIKSLSDKYHNAGVYRVSVNSNNLSSGVYFYKLIIDGIITDTKKLLIIK